MGNSASIADGSNAGTDNYDNDDDYDDPFDGIDTLGYRVLGVQPNSPAAAAGLVSFLEFLVGADGKMLLGSGEDLEPGQEYDDVDFPALLEENKGKPVELLVWNIKSQSARLVKIIPSDTWGGAGLLGVTIRLDNYAGAEDRLVRVLSIESPKSPAAIAGLVPEKDFLLGTTHLTLDSVDRLAAVLRHHEDEVVELYVYNTDEDKVRVVSLLPTSAWQGSRGGLLGAEVGTGYLHRLPYSARSTTGSSAERKVRYVEAVQTTDSTLKVSHSDPSKNPELNKNSATSAAKVLEMEPQLEMEPGEDEDHGGRRPLQSPSSVGFTANSQRKPEANEKASNVFENAPPSVLIPTTIPYGVPVQIFTPAVTVGPRTSHNSGNNMPVSGASLLHGGGSSKYPPSPSIPTYATPSHGIATVHAPAPQHQSAATPYYQQEVTVSQIGQSRSEMSVPSTVSLSQPPTYSALPLPPQPYSAALSYASGHLYTAPGPSYTSNPQPQQPYMTTAANDNPNIYYSQQQQAAQPYGYMNSQKQSLLHYSGRSV